MKTLLKEFEISDQTVGEQFENEEEKIAFEKASKVRSFFNFDEVGIKAGEELVFVRDDSITCTVHDSSTIKFNNEVTNLTAAVKDILDPERTGKTYNGVVFGNIKAKLFGIEERELEASSRFKLEINLLQVQSHTKSFES